MDGARWDDDNMCVEDSFPKVLWSEMAPIWLRPVEINKDTEDRTKVYQAPIYKTSERKGVLSTSGHSSNFIMWLGIPHSCNLVAVSVILIFIVASCCCCCCCCWLFCCFLLFVLLLVVVVVVVIVFYFYVFLEP
ncbi:unnamed protein product [Polarella glacialis]|uniref:Dynein heavy chain C-terminal domain-containing protein n=1 Tax=Polarella glacialis TaxID=89957 RepID=A0A813FNV7_POLGL|nr:unnamed protein product [Polarella glacialis]